MSERRFEFGDRVRHPRFPEWGIGSVIRLENVAANGASHQRLSVRFPAVGVKVLNSAHIALERVNDEAAAAEANGKHEQMHRWKDLSEEDWFAPMVQKKVREIMISLPEEVRDPFDSLRVRLQRTLALYRFDASGKGLMAWAIAQSGLDDPLSRFNRHELEELFKRWSSERETHMERLLDEARTRQPELIEELVAESTPPLVDVVRRVGAIR